MNIEINVANKVATVVGSPCIVCDNTDYVINFTFDSEWDSYTTKTARFTYIRDGINVYKEVVFEGTSCNAPILSNINGVRVGVYAGNLRTTTPANIQCKKSILGGSDVHEAPSIDIYNEIIELLNNKYINSIFAAESIAELEDILNGEAYESGVVYMIYYGESTTDLINGYLYECSVVNDGGAHKITYYKTLTLLKGTTFTPSVSSAGVLSWTNDGGKENPESVDIVTAVINALPSAVGVSF